MDVGQKSGQFECLQTKGSTCLNDSNNQIFSSIKVIYEEEDNLDISQLELESNRLMESIVKLD